MFYEKSSDDTQESCLFNTVSKIIFLRTVPTFVTAHTFCASRDTRVSYGWCLLIQGYFCAVKNYVEKGELSKCSWYPKRKLEVTMHFSEMIKLQSGKSLSLSQKMCGYPQFSFWVPITLSKICFPRIIVYHTKILPY